MLLHKTELDRCIEKVRRFRNLYEKSNPAYSARNIKSIDVLVDLVRQDGYLVDIRIMDLSYGAHAVRGACLSKGDRQFEILILAGQNTCWTRMVLCKEIFHGLLDAPEHRTTAVAKHIEESATIVLAETTPSAAVRNEIVAEVAAMEFIFPYQSRVLEMASTTVSYASIAERYKCPLQMVEKYLLMANMKALENL